MKYINKYMNTADRLLSRPAITKNRVNYVYRIPKQSKKVKKME